MGRRPCCDRETVNRGAWTLGEDRILSDYISLHGHGNWRHLAQNAGLNRCGKSCRLRWMNYLRPDIKRGAFSPEEDDLIIRFHRLLGNRWAMIARRIPGRTDNEIKNHWNRSLVRKSDPQISWACPRNSVLVTIQKEQPNIYNSDETPKDSLQSYSSTSEDCNSDSLSKDTNANPNFFLDLLLKTDNNIINDNNNVNAIIFGCNGKDNNLVDNEKDGNNIKCTDMSSLFGENNGEVMISSCEVGPSDVGVQTRDTFLSELKKVACFLELEDHEWEL